MLGFGYVPAGFMREWARPQFVVDLFLPKDTDIEVTAAELAEAEAHVRGKPGDTLVPIVSPAPLAERASADQRDFAPCAFSI